jgi:hypothetical protein
MESMDAWEEEGGLYPDLDDPRFTEKLMAKQEFAEAKQRSVAEQMREGVNPCDPDREFELSPVQRFVSRFLSPQCPYQSALLFHGVGVGKTCAAITIAENYLRSYPRRSVFIIAPRTIQPGFKREIFDAEELQIPDDESLPNTAKGCTGNSYLKRTATEYEKNRKAVVRRVTESINSRYTILGYIQFFRYIQDILDRVPAGLDPEAKRAAELRYLRREFSGRLVIIDEAHNLRDTPAEASSDAAGDDADVAGGNTELSESGAGKKLTPALIRVLEAAEGMKLVLATATPMYNSYKEILFLLNLLLINDKRDRRIALSEALVFTPDGRFRKAADGTPSGAELLGSVASAYVSFMRGENPLSFPVRLPPQGAPGLEAWPTYSPTGESIQEKSRARMSRLPFVPVTFEGESAEEYERISTDAIEAGGVGVVSIDEMVQAGNWLFPGEDGPQVRDVGFDECFKGGGGGAGDEEDERKGSATFTARGATGASWLLEDRLGAASPKAKFILGRLKTCKGVAFVYSRYIKSGALPLALALEANGYTPWDGGGGARPPLLTNGIQDKKGRQCALCERREVGHGTSGGHRFVPAKYVLITGKAAISKNNPVAIQASRAKTNMYGQDVKVVIGSSVASEGVNFRFMREVYVFDSWFHLNKLEQVLGRGIRSCSHALLPKELRNCTTYLLVNSFGERQDTETADLYMYRQAMAKALQVGRVTRVLKQYALDCNLNREAVLITGLAKRKQVDSQGVTRPSVNINDTDFTSMCDWIECEYDCAKPVEVGDPVEGGLDTSTYDEYAVKWREVEVKRAVRALFESKRQPAFQLETIVEALKGVPASAVGYVLADIVNNRAFQIRVRGVPGYVVYRNGYYLFQPDHLSDVRIPLSLRLADVPVRKDHYVPTEVRLRVVGAEGPAAAAAATKEEGEGAAEPDAAGGYWEAIKEWAAEIEAGTAKLEDTPRRVRRAVLSRYDADSQKRELHRLIMVNWFYESVRTAEDIGEDMRARALRALSEVLLEYVWDESLKPNEQQSILAGAAAVADERLAAVAAEQIARADARRAFRYIDAFSGKIQYMCDGKPCSPAVALQFENRKDDPLRGLRADRTTAGQIYGFIVPKGKEGRLIFKTSDTPAAPGAPAPKGAECENVSTVTHHIKMLKEIGEMYDAEGLPRFLLVDDVLDEKTRRLKERAEAVAARRQVAAANPNRSFENANKACALKNLSLRWLDKMAGAAAAGAAAAKRLRYFYRPIAAYKSGHKGVALKGV